MRNETVEQAGGERVDQALAALHGRAGRLRAQAKTMHPLVGKAYRRRAAELELAAWALAIRSGRPVTESRTPIAA